MACIITTPVPWRIYYELFLCILAKHGQGFRWATILAIFPPAGLRKTESLASPDKHTIINGVPLSGQLPGGLIRPRNQGSSDSSDFRDFADLHDEISRRRSKTNHVDGHPPIPKPTISTEGPTRSVIVRTCRHCIYYMIYNARHLLFSCHFRQGNRTHIDELLPLNWEALIEVDCKN